MASPYDLGYVARVAAQRKISARTLPDKINPYDLGHVAQVHAYLAERKMSPNNPGSPYDLSDRRKGFSGLVQGELEKKVNE
ncbi:MAG: hypothetical protein Q8R47_04675 [Nanoarchaeota archaeon]|nr:hypothetical protein [Nanoarchaeota archaeon]